MDAIATIKAKHYIRTKPGEGRYRIAESKYHVTVEYYSESFRIWFTVKRFKIGIQS